MTVVSIRPYPSAQVAALQWTTAKGISADSREAFKRVAEARPVDPRDVQQACIDALGANATRFGQSMARRYGREAIHCVMREYPVTDAAPSIPAAISSKAEAVQAFTLSLLTDAQRQRVADFARGYEVASR